MSFADFVRALKALGQFTRRQAFDVYLSNPSGFNFVCGWQLLFQKGMIRCMQKGTSRRAGNVWAIKHEHSVKPPMHN